MKRIIFAAAVPIFPAVIVAGCGLSGHPQTALTTPDVATASLPDIAASPIGGTLATHIPQGAAEYTISNPRIIGGKTRIDVAVTDRQGELSPGEFDGMDESGIRRPQSDDYNNGALDESGTMVPGEERKGWVDIPLIGIKSVHLTSNEVARVVAQWDIR